MPISGDAESSQEEPLPKALFELPLRKGCYISANFVTITKDPSLSGLEVIPPMRDFLRAWVTEEKPVLAQWLKGGYPSRPLTLY